jgi:poly(3-hydroxybutyrate) depolymerase
VIARWLAGDCAGERNQSHSRACKRARTSAGKEIFHDSHSACAFAFDRVLTLRECLLFGQSSCARNGRELGHSGQVRPRRDDRNRRKCGQRRLEQQRRYVGPGWNDKQWRDCPIRNGWGDEQRWERPVGKRRRNEHGRNQRGSRRRGRGRRVRVRYRRQRGGSLGFRWDWRSGRHERLWCGGQLGWCRRRRRGEKRRLRNGTTRTLQNGTINIMFNNASRNYILRVPEDYDNDHAYRLVFAFAESGSSAMSVATRNYFTLATLDSTNTIFVAPDAANGAGSWSQSDVDLTDLILAELEEDLCIDKSRIFATGFSFGGAMSLALACKRADVFRGVAFFSGADLTGSCTGTLTTPIAYYASQASGDSSGDPIPSSGRIKQAQFAELNGCMPEPEATTFPAPGQPHKCTVYQGCSAGHPTVYCVFDGPHGWEPRDPGESMSWNAPKAWEFITQF